MLDSYIFKKATILTGATVSDAVDILGYQVVGFIVPTSWTAANLSFEVDPGDGNYYVVTAPTFTTPTANQLTLVLATGGPPIIVGSKIKLVSSTAQLLADKVVLVQLVEL